MTPEQRPRFFSSTFYLALAGAAVTWASLPPLGLWPLAWIGPAFWAYLARPKQLAGRRPYAALWLVGFIYWTAVFYFLVLPHWAAGFGLLALSFYQAFYLPVFVGLTRVAVHRLRISIVFAAPVVWTGLELARAHLITGITMGNVGHSQYGWIELIQISDLAGAYAVSFVVMLAAAALARMVPCESRRWTVWPLLPAAAVLAAALVYGHFRVLPAGNLDERPVAARVALIQGSIDAEFKHDPAQQQTIQQQYVELTQKAVDKYGTDSRGSGLDLIVWPETMFRDTLFTYADDVMVPPEWRGLHDQFHKRMAETAAKSSEQASALAKSLNVPLLLGVDTIYYVGTSVPQETRSRECDIKRYNSALLLTASGEIVDRYDKMHRVIFGEYVPFADRLPWLQRLTPLPTSLAPGKEPKTFEVGGLRYTPNICYENVLPHLIRRQVNDGSPDVIVNLTNDGWYWGSSELDLHLICGVFRAVECRRPMLIAANTGFSAWIDGDGRILAQGPRRATGIIAAEVRRDERTSFYLAHGDWPAGACLAACIVLGGIGLVDLSRKVIDQKKCQSKT